AIGIAFVLNIPMRKLERLMKKRFANNGFLYKLVRGIAIFFTLILALVVMIVVGSLIIPSLVDSLLQQFQNMPA
ncbi:AI-2E family transporter, partial [Massilicoli timonensis]|nr:AI-2E family transporter [Massilicoli timonensis]